MVLDGQMILIQLKMYLDINIDNATGTISIEYQPAVAADGENTLNLVPFTGPMAAQVALPVVLVPHIRRPLVVFNGAVVQ